MALLWALSLADAVLTVAEAAHNHTTPASIEGNPVMRAVLEHWGVAGMFAAKAGPILALALLLIRRPVPGVVRALVGVFGLVLIYHAALVASW